MNKSIFDGHDSPRAAARAERCWPIRDHAEGYIHGTCGPRHVAATQQLSVNPGHRKYICSWNVLVFIMKCICYSYKVGKLYTRIGTVPGYGRVWIWIRSNSSFFIHHFIIFDMSDRALKSTGYHYDLRSNVIKSCLKMIVRYSCTPYYSVHMTSWVYSCTRPYIISYPRGEHCNAIILEYCNAIILCMIKH